MSLYKLVTFDATNTLIRVMGSVGLQYGRVANQHGIYANTDEVNKAFKTAWKQMNKDYPNYGVNQGLTSQKWWTDVMKSSLLSVCDKQSIDPDVLSKVANDLYTFFASNRGWEVIPGSEEGLALLKDKGLQLGIVSNFDNRLPNILTDLGIANYFNFILCSSVEKVAKPDADIFKKALHLGNTKAEETIHVGDDLTNDYLGAKNAGLRPIFFQNNPDIPLPDEVSEDSVISNMQDIIKLL